MNYSMKLNVVNKPKKNIKAFATVTFGDCFKITNIAVVENREGVLFVSMPSFKSRERTEHNEAVYKEVCNPITAGFRAELYGDILALYDEMERAGKTEISMKSEKSEESEEPEFHVKVTPYERDGSNIRGLARIYFEDCFVVSNVSIIQGKGTEFVAMPSYMVKQEGKTKYQDVCFPVTKEFRERLYTEILDCYQQEKNHAQEQKRMHTEPQRYTASENRQREREFPFR